MSVALVRLPVQVGTSSLSHLARGVAGSCPGAVLAIAGALQLVSGSRPLGVALLVAGLFLVVFGLAQLRYAVRTRAGDALLDDAGFAIEGGAHDGLRLAWAEIDRDRTRAETIEEKRISFLQIVAHGIFLFLSLLTNELELAPDVRMPIRRLVVVTRDGRTFELAQAEHPGEQSSIDALLGTIQARSTTNGPTASRAAQSNVLLCAGCGAPLVPEDVSAITCRACGRATPVPEGVRGRLRAQRQLAQARHGIEVAVRSLLDQPGAHRVNITLGLSAFVLLAAWSVIAAPLFWIGPRHAGVFELVWFLLAGSLAVLAAYFLAYATLADRRALRLLATGFGARPPVGPADGWGCRRCGGPLPASAELIVPCAYCDAENVLGIDLRPQVAQTQEHALSLGEVLGARAKERRSQRVGALVAMGIALVGAAMSFTWVSVAREHAERIASCERGDSEACTRIGANFDLGITTGEDDEEALRWYGRACDQGHADACHRAANLHRWGTGLTPDPAREKAFRTRACSLGHAEACHFDD